MTVYKEYYEVVGKAALAKARAFADARAKARDAQWAIVRSYGADAYRPMRYGSIRSLMFLPGKEVPAGLRKVGTENGMTEYEPSRGTTAGKKIYSELCAAPRVEEWGKFADEFGWKGRSPMDECHGGRTGMAIYHATGVHVKRPKERFMLQLPRERGDRWKKPPGLRQIRESQWLAHIEDHNAAVERAKKRKAGKPGCK